MKDIDEIFPIIIKNHKFIIDYDKLQIICFNCNIIYCDFSKYKLEYFKNVLESNYNNENGYLSLTRIKHFAYKTNCNEHIIQSIIE